MKGHLLPRRFRKKQAGGLCNICYALIICQIVRLRKIAAKAFSGAKIERNPVITKPLTEF